MSDAPRQMPAALELLTPHPQSLSPLRGEGSPQRASVSLLLPLWFYLTCSGGAARQLIQIVVAYATTICHALHSIEIQYPKALIEG